ncbi:IS3 family transposase [Desulfobacterales bacterium HSG17]|nr:IS3 family transposase [Desulfobacterales bacterium HSG17]
MDNLYNDYPIVRMASVFNINRGGFYRWKKHPFTKREIEDAKLSKKIKRIFFDNKYRYGSPRIARELKEEGITCSKNRACRLMRESNLVPKARRKFKITTNSKHNHKASPDLVKRDFKPPKPDQVWVSDLTYIKTRSGWLYLCIILELFSRKVIGWSMDKKMKTNMFIKALDMAYENRIPEPGVIFHSDRGIQYASDGFRQKLKNYQMVQSMSRQGNCLDNAPAESFFHTLKVEEVYGQTYETRQEAKSKLFEYIEIFYNRKRRHSYLGLVSPMDFEYKYNQKTYENAA